MAIPKRLDTALIKLYRAFNNNSLNPECCQQCAVGNILDNQDFWKHFSSDHGSLKLSYVGLVHQNLGRRFNGYTPLELLKIEFSFLEGCGYQLPFHYKNTKPKNPTDKDVLFNGLVAVIKLLSDMEDIENPTKITNLFKRNIENFVFD